MSTENIEGERFAFGKNWKQFVSKHLTPERIDEAQRTLLRFLGRESLEGNVFLDIGCGSGIHSLAAWSSRAQQVISFDYDSDSVAATEQLRQAVGAPDNWSVQQGSVLDRKFLATLHAADIVYSWGVLHHTGSMWEAIENAASLVTENGIFYTSLYTSDLFIDRTPEYWLDIKRRYNQSNSFQRIGWEFWYALRFDMLPNLIRLKNPFQKWLDYKAGNRGMAYWTDIRDWLGGWPMEFCGINETLKFCDDRLKLQLLNLRSGEACTEYLFRRKEASNDWDQKILKKVEIELKRPFVKLDGWVYSADVSGFEQPEHQTNDFPGRWTLLEDGLPIGLGRCQIEDVQRMGKGRFGTDGKHLFFAATDNSDPNLNHRKYSLWLFDGEAT